MPVQGYEMRNLLQPCLLLFVLEDPSHGYDLIERLNAVGMENIEAGHVYRVLRGLERDGFVESTWITPGTGPARRRYELTARGLAELDLWAQRLEEMRGLLDTYLERWARVSARADGLSADDMVMAESASRPADGDAGRAPDKTAVQVSTARPWREMAWPAR
jgi:PadR family transcriptional regulator PadR